MAFASGTSTAWVLTNDEANKQSSLVSINLKTDRSGNAIPLPEESAFGLTVPSMGDSVVLGSNGSTAYVANGIDHVIPVDLDTHSIGTAIAVPSADRVLSIESDQAWVAGQGGLTLVDLANGSTIAYDSIPGLTDAVASPDGKTLYAVASNQLVGFNSWLNSVCAALPSTPTSTSSPVSNATTAPLPSTTSSGPPASDSSGTTGSTLPLVCPKEPGSALTPSALTPAGTDVLSMIDSRSGAVEQTESLGFSPQTIVLGAGGSTASIVGLEGGDAVVAPVDLANLTVGAPIVVEVPANPLQGIEDAIYAALLAAAMLTIIIVVVVVMKRREGPTINEPWKPGPGPSEFVSRRYNPGYGPGSDLDTVSRPG